MEKSLNCVQNRFAALPLRCSAPKSAISGRRASRLTVRAEDNPIKQVQDAAKAEKDRLEKDVVDPLAKGTRPATEGPGGLDDEIIEAGKQETQALGTQISIPDALRFRSVGPEHINSRLAMVGVTTGYLTKLLTGKNTLDQYQAAPLPVIATFIIFIAASLIPITKGVTPDKAENGIWTAKAEIYNGRLAMLGFISLIVTDGWQWFSALQAAKGASLSN